MLRVVGPKTLDPDRPHLLRVEEQTKQGWRLVDPAALVVGVEGPASLVQDPSRQAMNPVTVRPDAREGAFTVNAAQGDRSASASFAIGPQAPAGSVRLQINPSRVLHEFQGLGGGVLFYDNQWELSQGDEIWKWCFEDVHATYLHLLARPDYERANDNDDWRTIDPAGFDFKASNRALKVAERALAIDPNLKLYLSVYSPPAWMKVGETTRGSAGLKAGKAYRQEFAEYVFAYLKHAASRGVRFEYFAPFNEPDWTHSQDGMHVKDFAELVGLFDDITTALAELIEADDDLEMPRLIFPDSLGAGALTRTRENRAVLTANRRMLEEKVDVWGVHDYWNTAGYWPVRFEELRALPPVGAKPIWMTEWAQRDNRGDLESANQYGANILNALRSGAQAWMVFEWCHPSGNQSGLISCDWGAKPPHKRYWRSQAYYTFQQLANTTPAGAQVVDVSAELSGIAKPSSKGQSLPVEYLALKTPQGMVLHVANTTGEPVTVEVEWRGDGGPAGGALVTDALRHSRPFTTDELALRTNRRSASFTAPANSLVTVVGWVEPAEGER
ncbi:glycoside hydrolase [Pirellulimonas nuda]|nr:hypothetical protein [Pirellulimonas nuda]